MEIPHSLLFGMPMDPVNIYNIFTTWGEAIMQKGGVGTSVGKFTVLLHSPLKTTA
jgi:hypothetical protein